MKFPRHFSFTSRVLRFEHRAFDLSQTSQRRDGSAIHLNQTCSQNGWAPQPSNKLPWLGWDAGEGERAGGGTVKEIPPSLPTRPNLAEGARLRVRTPRNWKQKHSTPLHDPGARSIVSVGNDIRAHCGLVSGEVGGNPQIVNGINWSGTWSWSLRQTETRCCGTTPGPADCPDPKDLHHYQIWLVSLHTQKNEKYFSRWIWISVLARPKWQGASPVHFSSSALSFSKSPPGFLFVCSGFFPQTFDSVTLSVYVAWRVSRIPRKRFWKSSCIQHALEERRMAPIIWKSVSLMQNLLPFQLQTRDRRFLGQNASIGIWLVKILRVLRNWYAAGIPLSLTAPTQSQS